MSKIECKMIVVLVSEIERKNRKFDEIVKPETVLF